MQFQVLFFVCVNVLSTVTLAAPTVQGETVVAARAVPVFGGHKNGYEGESKRTVPSFGGHKNGYEGESKRAVPPFGGHKDGYE
ncbi:hypothetical protein GQ53DRAFT_817679 [Thozetella sp. PMI_491]|nr:hypothetical protein GQ53DRAFT_817679 [Thozetella sp. PMI_491]